MDQQTLFGYGSIDHLKKILKDCKVKNVFLVTGKTSFEFCGAKRKLDLLLSSYRVTRFYDFDTNPQLSDIIKGIELYEDNKYDVTVAIGGGSVIDMAKLINLFSNQPHRPVDYIKKKESDFEPVMPLVAIPTTAGSGSEATHFAVVYIDKVKYSVANEFIKPKYSLIDPTFTLNLPQKQTAITGIDALSQAVESYWSVNSTEESKKYSKESIELIMDNLNEAINKSSKKSREAMAKAANLAGKAINITKTTASHAISYALTSYWKIPHGHAVGISLGEILIFNSLVTDEDINDKRGVKYVNKTIAEINKIMKCQDVYSSSEKISNLMEKIGLETRLSSLGLEEDDLEIIIENVNLERLVNNPRELSKNSLRELLLRIL